MTFCFVFSNSNMSIVAADTRVNFTTGEGFNFVHDGPEDCYVTETSRNYNLVIPFKFRKIRRAGDGWITSSGDFMLGKSILDKLSFTGSDDFESANSLLIKELPKLKSEIQQLTGFSEVQQRDTAILGAPFGANSVWLISLNQELAKTESIAGSYLASWPPGMSAQATSYAQVFFEEQFQKAYSEKNLLNIVRSLVRLVYVAAEHSNTVGLFTQIGLTLAISTQEKISFYLEGNSSELLSMADNDLQNTLTKID